MATLNPYLFFNGNCREAMEFYQSNLGGKLDIMTVGESPMAENFPKERHDEIFHCMLATDKIVLMASDWMAEGKAQDGTHVSLVLNCESKDEAESLYSKLSEGGKVTMPLKDEFFGTLGAFTDKFGINWMVEYSKDENRD